MTRRLRTDDLMALFSGRWMETGDLEECLELVYEAGRSSAMKAVLKARRPRRAMVFPISAAPILAAVAARHRTTVDKLVSGGREFASARFEVMWLLRQEGESFPSIAAATLRDNHTSAIYGVHEVNERIREQPGLRDELLALVERAPALRSVG